MDLYSDPTKTSGGSDIPVAQTGSMNYDDQFMGFSEEDILGEIVAKVSDFENMMNSFLQRYNQYADAWKILLTDAPNEKGSSTYRTSETHRATETLATMMHRMWNASDPNFEVLPQTDLTNPYQVEASKEIIRKQQRWLRYPEKQLMAARSMCLFGTVVVETPWASMPDHAISPFMEGTDFIPRSLVQVGFDRTSSSIEESDWIYSADLTSSGRMRRLMQGRDSEYVWIKENIQKAIDDFGDIKQLDKGVVYRLNRAGYNLQQGKVFPMELITYHGMLDIAKDGKDYCVGILNRRHLVRFHLNPFQHRMRPFRVARMVSFELEPYGYGIGQIGERLQFQLDSNRNRVNDAITFSHYHMWLLSRFAGIKPSDIKIKPWHIIPADDTGPSALRELKIDSEAIQHGLKLEDMLKEDFRAVTAASDNLQAMVTDATATEASLAQSEAVRRVSVMAEVAADNLLWPHLYVMHQNNLQFLDKPIWLKLSGQPKPLRFDPTRHLPEFLDFEMKLTTDRDFAPNRAKRLIEAIQMLTSMRNMVPANINVAPLVGELVRALQIDPMKVISPQTLPQEMQSGAGAMPGGPPGGNMPTNSPELPGVPEEGSKVTGMTQVEMGNRGQASHVPAITSEGPLGPR